MHVFLTGAKQVGKTTVVWRVIERWTGEYGGFETYFDDRDTPDKALFMQDVRMPRSFDDENLIATFEGGQPTPIPAQFDAIGTDILRNMAIDTDLVIMDELGRLEQGASRFQRAVLSTLRRPVPVLGVLQRDAGGWTQAILDMPGIKFINVTKGNRNNLAPQIMELLRS